MTATANSTNLLDRLRSIVGPEGMLTAPSDLMVYECDGFTIEKNKPEVVVFPISTEQVVIAVVAEDQVVSVAAKKPAARELGVVVVAAVQFIIVPAAEQDVDAVAPEQEVPGASAGKHVVARQTVQRVAAPQPDQEVCESVAGEDIAEVAAGDVLDPCQGVGAAAAGMPAARFTDESRIGLKGCKVAISGLAVRQPRCPLTQHRRSSPLRVAL